MRDELPDLQAFAICVGTRLDDHLRTVGRLRGLDAHLAVFLRKIRLIKGTLGLVSPYVGKIAAVLLATPPLFRADLERWHRAVLAEREYRHEAGEPYASDIAVFNRVRSISAWAKWLSSHDLISWQEFTPQLFRARLLHLGCADKIGAVNTHFDLLTTYCRWLQHERRIFANPLRKVRRPPASVLKQRSLHDSELVRSLRIAIDSDTSPSTRAVGLLTILHGLTIHELRALRRSDFDGTRRTLKVAERRLVLELDPPTADALATYLHVRPRASTNRHLFVTQRTRLSTQAASTGFVAARLRVLGVRGRAVRQRLIKQLATDANAVVAARYFAVSVVTIDRHMNHQSALMLPKNVACDDFVQDNR